MIIINIITLFIEDLYVNDYIIIIIFILLLRTGVSMIIINIIIIILLLMITINNQYLQVINSRAGYTMQS